MIQHDTHDIIYDHISCEDMVYDLTINIFPYTKFLLVYVHMSYDR